MCSIHLQHIELKGGGAKEPLYTDSPLKGLGEGGPQGEPETEGQGRVLPPPAQIVLITPWNVPIEPQGDGASLKGGGSQTTCSGCPDNDWLVGCLWVPWSPKLSRRFSAPVRSLVLLMIENTVRNKALAAFPGSTSACLPPRPPTPQPPLVKTEAGREGFADTDGAFMCSLALTL